MRRIVPLIALAVVCTWFALLLWSAKRSFAPDISGGDWSAFWQGAFPPLLVCLAIIASWFLVRAIRPKAVLSFAIATLAILSLVFAVTSGHVWAVIVVGILGGGSSLVGFRCPPPPALCS